MRILSTLLCVALLATATMASSLGWIVLPGLSVQQSEELIPSHDVRAILPDTAFLVGDFETFASLKKIFPNAILAGAYDPKLSYLTIERPEFERVDAMDESAWAFNALSAIHRANLQVVFAGSLRYLVASNGLVRSTYEGFPAETEFVALPQSKILPVQRFQDSEVVYRADIAALVNQVSTDSLLDFDLYLSGESLASNLTTRNSFSTQVHQAADWIEDKFRASGFSVTQESFQSTYGPNVIASLRGTQYPNTYVIIGGHFDSRGPSSSSPTNRAPGANDDGSGTSALLEIARLISLNRLQFRYSVIIGAWCGEEQGLVGSRAYAKAARDSGMDIKAMLQSDMIAYRVPGERAQVAFPDRYHTPALTTQVKSIINTYVPEIDACETTACCSDQQSFYEQGYAATFFFERCNPLADNQYHREGDLVNRVGFDTEQWTLITQSVFASLLTLAEVL